MKFNRKLACMLVIPYMILPVLGLFQVVDPYLSFSLYSGDVPHGRLIFDEATHRKLPGKVQRLCYLDKEQNLWHIDLTDWALIETTAPVYPSRLCITKMAKEFTQTYDADFVLLQITTYPKLASAVQKEEITYGQWTKRNISYAMNTVH